MDAVWVHIYTHSRRNLGWVVDTSNLSYIALAYSTPEDRTFLAYGTRNFKIPFRFHEDFIGNLKDRVLFQWKLIFSQLDLRMAVALSRKVSPSG